LRESLIHTIETFQRSECLENKLVLLNEGLFVTNDHITYGYGVKSEDELQEIKLTYFEPQSELYLPGAVQGNLKKFRKLVDSM
jgi:hypothetical protein